MHGKSIMHWKDESRMHELINGNSMDAWWTYLRINSINYYSIDYKADRSDYEILWTKMSWHEMYMMNAWMKGHECMN